MDEIASGLYEKALQLVRKEYQTAADMRAFALRVGVDHINRVRPPSIRYGSVEEVFREFMHGAGAVADFAVELGLISPEEAGQVIRDLYAAQPELPRDEDFEVPSE